METYVVRIYRRPDKEGKELLGTVEIVGEEGNKLFNTLNELVDIISAHKKSAKGPAPKSGQRRYYERADIATFSRGVQAVIGTLRQLIEVPSE